MNARAPASASQIEPNAIRLVDRRIKLPILDEADNQLGLIVFDPDDIGAYEALTDMAQQAMEAGTAENARQAALEKVAEMPEELENPEDFAQAARFVGQVKASVQAASKIYDDLYAGLNRVFGGGEDVCKHFAMGGRNVDALMVLIEHVAPYYQASRKKKTAQYYVPDRK